MLAQHLCAENVVRIPQGLSPFSSVFLIEMINLNKVN